MMLRLLHSSVECPQALSIAGADISSPAGAAPSLRPLVWFIFNTVDEVQAAIEFTRDSCLHHSVR